MNPFFSPYDYSQDVPHRVYARLDQTELVDETLFLRRVLLEALDADWYDKNPSNKLNRDKFFHEIPLAVLEADVGPNTPITSNYESFLRLAFDPYAEEDGGRWVEIELTDLPGNLPISVYPGLFGPANTRGIDQAQPVAEGLNRKLDEAFSLDDVENVNADMLRRTLDSLGKIGFAAVYDVGQGNCNGLCDAYGSVRCYFDFGGGVLGNASTFPSQLQHFCFTYDPPVVLSHWDWDHWSSANRDLGAISQTWIVPRQLLGAIHRTFAHHVQQNGRLLVWPNSLPKLTVGHVTVLKCTGRGRNHSGLALILHEHSNGTGQTMLFTGDARYNVIPHSEEGTFTNIVVPHHGANMRNRFAPSCPQVPHCRLAYSYGLDNTFNHPRWITRTDHNTQGWFDNQLTPSTPQHFNIETVGLASRKPQHIMLRWHAAAQLLPPLPCNGQCNLQLQQQ